MSDSPFRRPGDTENPPLPTEENNEPVTDHTIRYRPENGSSEPAPDNSHTTVIPPLPSEDPSDNTDSFNIDMDPLLPGLDSAHTTIIPTVTKGEGSEESPVTLSGGKRLPGRMLFGKIPLTPPVIAILSGTAALLFIVLFCFVLWNGLEAPVTESPAEENPAAESIVASMTPPPTPSPEPTPEESVMVYEETDLNPLTGLLLTDNSTYGERPIAVMHNNIRAALPMHGISQADILYEVLAEGNITRLVGIYKEYAPIVSFGAVRSTRTYYLELALAHDAMLVHAGASYIAYNDIQRWGMTTIDGIKGAYGKYFWRDQGRIQAGVSSEHTLFTSGENIREAVEGLGMTAHQSDFRETLQFTFDGTPADGKTAEKINVQFLSTKTTSFQYDEERALYTVMEFGENMIDGSTKTQVAVTNVLVLKAEMTVIPGDSEGRRQANLSSGGSGYFACGGRYIPIQWSRDSYDGQFSYTGEDGEPLELGAGKSYICIVPTSAPDPTFLRN